MIYFFPPLPVAEWKRPVSSMHHWIHAERKSSGVCTVSANRDSDWASKPVVSMRGLSCFYFVYMHVNDASVSALSIRYQQILHRNIVYLATIADASPDNFPPATYVGTVHCQPLSYWCSLLWLVTDQNTVVCFQSTPNEPSGSTAAVNGPEGTWWQILTTTAREKSYLFLFSHGGHAQARCLQWSYVLFDV